MSSRPTFRPHHGRTLPDVIRPPSPQQPVIEPLSPSVKPAATPYFSFINDYLHKRSGLAYGTFASPSKARARKTTQETVAPDSRRAYPHGHKRKSSSAIDELAEVAIAASESPLSRAREPLYSSNRHYVASHHNAHHASNERHALPTSTNTSTRPAKRARSEAFVHSSYSTPQVPAHANFHTQSQTGQPARVPASTDYEAAALLLAFGGHATNVIAPPFGPSPTPSSQSRIRTSSLPVPPPLQHHWVNAPVAALPPPFASHHVPSAANYLPSPQTTTEEAYSSSKEPSDHDVRGSEDPADRGLGLQQSMQINTPPDDEISGTTKLESTADMLNHDRKLDSTPGDVEEVKPKRKGWPKGKPRGPRKSASIATSKPKPSGRRRGRPAATKAAEQVSTPRRKSFTEFDLPRSTYDHHIPIRASSVPRNCRYLPGKPRSTNGKKALPKLTSNTVCESCQTARESAFGESDTWVSCNGCKRWFHTDCAGFKNVREVHDVDKYFCVTCEPAHGSTTFVRKSTRAHTAVDYAGLNQGVLKTSDDCKEHHYIQRIKDGSHTFDDEVFPRMRPELITADYFERSACFNQPILVPAEFNPKLGSKQHGWSEQVDHVGQRPDDITTFHPSDIHVLPDYEYESVPNDGQDKLDMVIPQDLTVRKVCELVGPDYPLDVIDTKAQGTEGRMWNLGRWADYYELDGEKDIRNVISLEVSATKLGRLLRRPKLVRQIDLQDNVWPPEEPAKSVAFYCLMSAADSYTDFHIDFGGSSVYYHILRGSKTFLFIPPKAKHLKAYEDWNNSPYQDSTFLPNITKECYRVDLYEGDTMLIPSGWIHAVWTPSDSLVIGGNFLTHMHYSMQFKVVEVEKANKTPQKFRYPKFQKVMWYAALKYLSDDPLPENVKETFYSGERFLREVPTWQEFDQVGDHTEKGNDYYNARYYSQQELDGLPELVSFIFRTVMISQDRIEGITVESRKAVIASIPKSYGNPLELAKTFALWTAWKRGNEDPPAWAHPDAGLPEKEASNEPKKLSAKMLKQVQRLEAFEAFKLGSGRQSLRRKDQEAAKVKEVEVLTPKNAPAQPLTSTPKTSGLGPKRIACDACRRRRIRCKHKEELAAGASTVTDAPEPSHKDAREVAQVVMPRMPKSVAAEVSPSVKADEGQQWDHKTIGTAGLATPIRGSSDMVPVASLADSQFTTPGMSSHPPQTRDVDASGKRGRSKACADCRKSKRRCIHDENGQIDPVKEKQTPVPRTNASKKRKSTDGLSPDFKRTKHEPEDTQPLFTTPTFTSDIFDLQGDVQVARESSQRLDPEASVDQQPDDATAASAQASFEQFAAQALQQSMLAAHSGSSLPASEGAARLDAAPKDTLLVTVRQMGSTDSGVAIPQVKHMRPDSANDVLPSISRNAPIAPVASNSPEDVGVHLVESTTSVGTLSAVEEAAASRPKGDDSYQTPAANEPPSLSSASSPLSSTNATPEPEMPVYQSTEPVTFRHSSRSSRPVERFSSNTFAGSLITPSTISPSKAKAAAPSPTASGTRKRSSSTITSSQPTTSEMLMKDLIAVANTGKNNPPRSRSKTPGSEVKTEQQLQEEESMRLARELAGENFGLRVRRGVS